MANRTLGQSLRPAGVLLAVAMGIACGGNAGGDTDGDAETGGEAIDPEAAIQEARETIPDYLTLHSTVIARTCSPDGGVCHNSKEYPDLSSAQAMLETTLGRDCNLTLEDHTNTFTGCERAGDEITLLYGPNADFRTEIAWVEPVMNGGVVTATRLHLRDSIPTPMSADPENMSITRVYDDGAELEIAAFWGRITYDGDEAVVNEVGTLQESEQELLADGLREGDPNRDGVFGADENAFQVVTPGDPDRSYLLGRLLGVVPGTPMPLANQPLSSAEMLALTCWIEGVTMDGGVYDLIDYDACEAAENFGKGDSESGHSFSKDVRPILARCTAGGCHAAESPAAGLDLESDDARTNLLRASDQDPETLRVVPGNPTNSYLIIKLRGQGVTGLQMPREATGPGEPLAEDELQTIERWIVAGAPAD